MNPEQRRIVEAELAAIIEGSASEEVTELVASNDEARDLVYDAERAVEVATDAASDYDADAARIEALVARQLDEASDDGNEDADERSDDEASSSPSETEGSATSEEPSAGRRVDSDEASEEPPPPKDDSEAQKRRRLWGIAAIGAIVFGILFLGLRNKQSSQGGDAEGWAGRAARISRAFGSGTGLERCSPDEAVCTTLSADGEVLAGSILKTDGQTRALVEFADGSRLVMDRSSRVTLKTGGERGLVVERGSIVIDVEPDGVGAPATIQLAGGRVETDDAKLSIDVARDRSRVDVARGSARVVDDEGNAVQALVGETVDLRHDGLRTSATWDLADRIAWSETTFAAERAEERASLVGLGELVAKKPGSRDELPGAVTLSSHKVSVRISGGMARTEVEEVFQNHTADVLEGILRFPLPPGAQIERLALETDGKLEEGAFVDRDRAAAIWRGAIANAAPKAPKPKEEIVWVPGPWRDPALLEWQRGGRFELRVFPIPKKGSRRVVLAYTERVARAGERRRYRLPLPHDPGGTARLERFGVEITVRGHDRALGVRAVGYDVDASDESGVARMTMNRDDFSPSGDLVVEYGLPGRDRELSAWAYTPGPDEVEGAPNDSPALLSSTPADAPFALIALRPKLPRWADTESRSYAIVVDSSRSMIGERFSRARRLATTMVRELGRSEPVRVLACDVTCRVAPGNGGGGVQRAAEVQAFLEGITPEGGSDVTAAVQAGLTHAAASSGAARVVYIGDGTATVGPTEQAFVEHDVRRALEGRDAQVTAVPVGGDADIAVLRGVAAAGRGVVVHHVPGRTVLDTAYDVLAATYGHSLSDAKLTLPDGFVDVAPARLPTLTAGGETFVVARMTRPTIEGTVELTGQVGGKRFDQSYPLRVVATTGKGNAFVPRMFAAKHIDDLERDGSREARERAVALSSRYSVASRFTSLLVLESPAMFRAFGLDNERRVATWTGDEDDEATGADGDMFYELEDADDFASLGTGNGAAGIGATRSAPRPKKRKARDMAPSDPFGDFAPAPMPRPSPAPASRPRAAAPSMEAEEKADSVLDMERRERRRPPPPPPRRRMIPMKKIWERHGKLDPDETVPSDVDSGAIADARAEAEGDLRRDAMSRLYRLYFRAGRLAEAGEVAERWSAKDPLDAGALTARADVAAAMGDRDLAIRILGSVVDVRPGDHKAQWRLARLHRWAGRGELGCRHSLAVSQIRPGDAKLLVEAVRCARDTGQSSLADRLLGATDDATRETTERLLGEKAPDPFALRGDLKLEATWDGGVDLDLSMVHPDGHRVSWLGAPTRSVITAKDVLSSGREGLALRGAKPGEYVIEITRAGPGGPTVRGSIDVTVGKTKKSVPFSLDGRTARVGVAKVYMKSRLVPAGRARPVLSPW